MTAAYDVLAPHYDALTGDYGYDVWLEQLERVAIAHGLRGSRVLDLACGDGNSFMPLLERGYEVTACDVSPAMIAAAARRCEGRARTLVADVRELPELGRFDLITCLGDVPNHLASLAEVRAALAGMHRNLRPGGLALFDVNLLAAYRDVPDVVIDGGEFLAVWSGRAAEIREPGGAGHLVVDVFERDGEHWRRVTCRQPHRHFPLSDVRAALEAVGLRAAAILGQRTGAVLDPVADETVHPKAVVLARRPPAGNGRRD